MRARSLNCKNCFKLSENNEFVLKSGQNLVEILKFADLVFQSENQYPGGYQNELQYAAALVILKKICENLAKIQPKNRNFQF